MALLCPSCGYANNEDARFCSGCGAPLVGASPATPPTEERRLVSILFADLAGFTSRSDQADPEDVRRTLMPFHAIAKEEIERFGGTLDKFIGDAAMGVFGAPTAHEDDPERAVRAALAIQARGGDLEVPVRAAVNTGEAVVTFASGPQIGENVAGDVVNTASRLQGVAPLGGVVVGESTYRATRAGIDYRELEPVAVKGKAEPLRVWAVEAVRTQAPGRPDQEDTPFVDRSAERALLQELLDATIAERSLRLVTIVGEAGIGKTRLLAELREHARAATPAAWYRGRCLPYGESVTFAPLQEVVREIAAIAHADPRDEASRKLVAAIERVERGAREAEWLRARLAPLLGLAETGEEATANREESFAAWSRFLGAEARHRPAVVVIEDLHWADPAMLEFLERLARGSQDAPLLLLGTTRTELFDRRPDWPSAVPDARTIRLDALSDPDMVELLAGLVARTVLPPEVRTPLVATAGGNPLFALEFVRMLGDRGAIADISSIEVPETIHGLITARLDALTPPERAVLHAAAVVGDPFWAGAVAAMEPDADVATSLRELERRGLIQPVASSAMDGEPSLSFTHGLIRDVAYGQIPRAGRAARHLATARWLEATAGERLEDRAELLAHHTSEALALSRAAGVTDDLTSLEDDARRFLLLAGERQALLDLALGHAYLRRALELTPPGHPLRSELVRKATVLGWRSGNLEVTEAIDAYREAIDEALARDDRRDAAQAMRRLYYQLGFAGRTAEARDTLNRALELLADDADPVMAELYACLAEDDMMAGRSEASLGWAGKALELPHTDTVEVMALHIRGNGRCELGDLAGLDDLWTALRTAEASGNAQDLVTSYGYLDEWVGLTEGPGPGLELNEAALEICDRRGIHAQGMWARAESMWLLYDAGRWDQLLARADELVDWATTHGDAIVDAVGRCYRHRVLAHRGSTEGAETFLNVTVQDAMHHDPQVLAPVLVSAALLEDVLGHAQTALDHVRVFDDATRDGPTEYRELQTPELIRLCLKHGQVELASTVLGDRPVFVARTQHAVATGRAALAEAAGDHRRGLALFREAADAWQTYGDPFERAHALAGEARCLSQLGRVDEARQPQTDARQLFDELAVP